MWNDLTTSIPKVCTNVLVCTDKGSVSVGYLAKRHENLWHIFDQELAEEKVIAWQRLPNSFQFSKGIERNPKKHTDIEFTEQEHDLGDKAFIETMDMIRSCVRDYLQKDEIIHEIWAAARLGVIDFLSEYGTEFLDPIIEKVIEKIDIRITAGGKSL